LERVGRRGIGEIGDAARRSFGGAGRIGNLADRGPRYAGKKFLVLGLQGNFILV
jgi:hypothetical protein